MRSLDDYFLNLEKALKAVDRIVTDNGLWIVTYHSASKRVWEGVRKCFFSIGLKPPDYEEIMSHEIRAVGGSFIAHRYGSIGKDAYIVMEKAPSRITPKIISEHDFVAEVVKRMKRDLQRTKGLVSWNMFSAHYPHVVWKIGAPPIEGGNDSYKKLFEKYIFPLTSEWRIFDRDKIGDEVWKEVYDAIPAEKLLTNCMRLFAEGKGRKIKREELVYGLLQKIDGRIDDRLISEVLERNFTYDLTEEVYVLHEIKGPMDIFLPKPGTFPSPAKYEAAPPPPEKVIFRYTETAKMFGHKILYKKAQRSARGLSATEALFDLIIETSKGRIYISVNDTTPVKQAAYYWSEAERLNRPIVFIYYGKKVDEIREATNKITVYAIIYDKWEEVERALKAANPLEKLEVYRLGN